MRHIHYSPKQLSEFTLPQMMALLSEKLPTERKLESMAEFSKIIEEEARKEQEWNSR